MYYCNITQRVRGGAWPEGTLGNHTFSGSRTDRVSSPAPSKLLENTHRIRDFLNREPAPDLPVLGFAWSRSGTSLIPVKDTNPLWGCIRKSICFKTLPNQTCKSTCYGDPCDQGVAERSFSKKPCTAWSGCDMLLTWYQRLQSDKPSIISSVYHQINKSTVNFLYTFKPVTQTHTDFLFLPRDAITAGAMRSDGGRAAGWGKQRLNTCGGAVKHSGGIPHPA